MSTSFGLIIPLAAEARSLLGRQKLPGASRPEILHVRDGSILLVSCCGMGPGSSTTAARAMADLGADALILVGVAGGLDPALKTGDLILPPTILEHRIRRRPLSLRTAAEWGELCCGALEKGGVRVHRGPLLSTARPVADTAEKSVLRRQTGALAVDMEGAAVARVAKERSLPLLVLRAICDPADRSLPRELLGELRENGAVRPFHLLRGMIRRPSLAGDLYRIRREFLLAVSILRRSWPVLPETFPGKQKEPVKVFPGAAVARGRGPGPVGSRQAI